jgi:hypothetical protein
MTNEEKHQMMFMQLVLMFHSLTMQQLGKVKNPMTDTIERNLAGAQSSIEMLDMLKEKTKGNLKLEEDRFLQQLVKEAKLNYVDEANKPEPPAGAPAPSAEGTPQS